MKISEIIEGINRTLLEIYPEFVFYSQKMEADFLRPSIFIDLIRISPQKNISNAVCKKTAYFELVYFAPTDEYYNAEKTGLYDVTDDILSVLSAGYITAGDRAVKTTAASAGVNQDAAYIDITAEYTDYTRMYSMREQAEEQTEKMKDIFIREE